VVGLHHDPHGEDGSIPGHPPGVATGPGGGEWGQAYREHRIQTKEIAVNAREAVKVLHEFVDNHVNEFYPGEEKEEAYLAIDTLEHLSRLELILTVVDVDIVKDTWAKRKHEYWGRLWNEGNEVAESCSDTLPELIQDLDSKARKLEQETGLCRRH